ncbi:sensor histidine kinase [Gemella cuniculi]|uniref:sensor histidine kinase n=1 Tax=Gemella cuniculi TaxID=150240 RepID=UPI0004250ED0|nr:HAMP domain-containing sensor histidine kinase [Gemella cuniculi]
MIKFLKKFYSWHQNKYFLWWLLVKFIMLFVFVYLFYYAVYFAMLKMNVVDWETFSSLVWVLLPYTQILLIGVLWMSSSIEKYITRLTDSISKVAHGDFNTRISLDKSGPFKKVYEDFNLMVDELEHVQSLRDDFTNQFSHEFKTPITSIQGFAKLLKNPELSEEKRQLYAQTIEKEATRLANLSSNVMTLTSLERQEIISNKHDFDLTEHIRQAVILAYPNAIKKNIQIDLKLVENYTYYGNPDLLTHVWNNLINNAIKFTPKNGNIWIKSWISDNSFKVSFINDGPLIPEEKLSYLFEKFYQEDTSGSKEGLGLGLAITKRVLDLSGGSISVSSSIKNLTQFTVTLKI